MLHVFLYLISVFGFALSVHAQAALENPAAGSHQSGVGLISGWKCTGSNVTAVVDGIHTLSVSYGTSRTDTQGVCGDSDNGFGLLLNWNLLSDGAHTIRLYDAGVEFASATFTIQTLGGEFLRGINKTIEVPNFPNAGQTTTLQWAEAAQNFAITGLSTGGNAALSALLGRWSFSFTIISTFTNRYDLQRIDTSTGTPVIVGEDQYGDPIIAARVQDLINDPFPYEFALLDPSVILCYFFVFNQTGPNALSGRYIQLPRTATSCGSPTGSDYPMTGVRLSTQYEISSFETPESQEALLMQESQRRTHVDESVVLDPSALALMVRQLEQQ